MLRILDAMISEKKDEYEFETRVWAFLVESEQKGEVVDLAYIHVRTLAGALDALEELRERYESGL